MNLAKGQNVPLDAAAVVVTVEASFTHDLSALAVGPDDQVRGSSDFVFWNQPSRAALTLRDGALHVDLTTLDAHRVYCLVSVDADAPPLGALAPAVVRAGDAEFVLADLAGERVVIALEFYRRNGAWRLRAVGQGHAEGLAALAARHGVAIADDEPLDAPAPPGPFSDESVPGRPAPDVPAPTENPYAQVWSIYEDFARSCAALESATSYADQRREDELSATLDDPRLRMSAAADQARAGADARYAELVGRAQADHDRDVAVLGAELRGVEAVLPAPMAPWSSPAWRRWTPPVEPARGIRLGELSRGAFSVPMLLALPLSRTLWVDTVGGSGVSLLRSLVVRLLAAHPPGTLDVHVADLPGTLSAALTPLSTDTVRTPAQLSAMLVALAGQVDLADMAEQAGEQPQGPQRLIVLHEFPYGLGDAELALVRYLMDDGPRRGVTLLVSADGTEARDRGPVVSSLFQHFFRLTARPDDHIGDPWVDLQWLYTPDAPAPDTVLTTLDAAGRRR